MERVCDTGIKVLGRKFEVARSGAVMLLGEHGRLPEVVWWPPIEIAKRVCAEYDMMKYYIDDDGFLACRPRAAYEVIWPDELYMDVW
jgi:hypothetical protein